MEQEIKLHTLSIDAEKSTESSIVIYTTDDDQVSCVKSKRGTQFRIWANRILKEYLIKGYAINVKIKLEHYYELKNIVLLSCTINFFKFVQYCCQLQFCTSNDQISS